MKLAWTVFGRKLRSRTCRCFGLVAVLACYVGEGGTAQAQVTGILAALPDEIELPVMSTEGSVPVRFGKLTASEFKGCVLALRNPGGQTATALVYDLKDDSEQAAWQAIASRTGTTTPVGKFYIYDDNLTFNWLSGVTRAVAAGLCNCLLEVTSGSESRLIGLRVPAREIASVLDLRKDLTTINVAGADLPDDAALRFELNELAGYGKVLQYDPPNKRVGFKQPLKLVLKKADKDSPGIELHLTLMKNASKVNINIRPLMVAENGATLPFTKNRLVDVSNGLDNELLAANNAKAADEKQVIRVQENLLSLSVVVGTAQEIALARQRRADLQRQLAALQAEIKVLETNIAAIDRRIKALPALGELGNAIHEKASFNFRVFYLVGNKSVDVFSVEPKKGP